MPGNLILDHSHFQSLELVDLLLVDKINLLLVAELWLLSSSDVEAVMAISNTAPLIMAPKFS